MIENFDGCNGVTLLQNISNPAIMFTYSIWYNEFALNRYRNSDLFKKTWTKTKAMFEIPAEAWSVDTV